MGTRNLTAVYLDGQYKVAQYGQWDGYPEGQGITVLTFLRDKMGIWNCLRKRCGTRPTSPVRSLLLSGSNTGQTKTDWSRWKTWIG